MCVVRRNTAELDVWHLKAYVSWKTEVYGVDVVRGTSILLYIIYWYPSLRFLGSLSHPPHPETLVDRSAVCCQRYSRFVFLGTYIHKLLSRLHTEVFKDQFLLSSPYCWSFKYTEKIIWSNHFHTLLLPSVLRTWEQYTAWVTQSHHWYQQCQQRLMKDIKFLMSISPVYIEV